MKNISLLLSLLGKSRDTKRSFVKSKKILHHGGMVKSFEK